MTAKVVTKPKLLEFGRMPLHPLRGSLRTRRWTERHVGSWSTTPGRLRIARAALVIAVLATGAVGSYSVDVRSDAVREIAVRIEPLSTGATELYRSLADADATATNGLVSAGAEPTAFRERYDRNIERATANLVDAATRTGDDIVATNRIAAIGAQLPVYTALVERARSNNRQGFPVGGAYLRHASDLMRSTILPAAEQLQRSQAERLDDEYARAGTVPVGALSLFVVSLAGLVWVQVLLCRRTRRVFNVGLVVSTVAVVGTLLWWTVASVSYHGDLAGSQRHNQSVTDALGLAQIEALQARASESLTLVTRGGGSTGEQNFSVFAQRLARDDGAGGALGAARQLASDEQGRTLVETALTETRGYLSAHAQVRQLDESGQYAEAVASAIGPDGASAVAFARLDTALDEAIKYEHAGFAGDIARAGGWLTGLLVGTGLLALVAAAGVVIGIGRRLKEYP